MKPDTKKKVRAMVTAQTSDSRLAKRAYKISTCCLLAILLYSCNPSSGPGELFPKPGSPKEDTTTTQKENSNVEQQNSIVSAPAPPADTNASLSTANAIAPSSHSERTGSHDVVVSSQGPDLGREIGQLESTNENNNEPPLAPQEILDTKLNNPHAALTPNQSISLIHHCAELGEHNAASAIDKEVLMVLGNTGEGKSTTVNYWLGCGMKLVKRSELGLPGHRKVVVVDPESIRPEVMTIGHGRRSQTFMPQIVPDPDHDHRAYCDCPGFSDNRGPEINIANAINTRRVLQQARGVKAVFLASYQGLSDDRGDRIKALESMCHQMFGGPENLRRHQNSVLLGITKAPLYEDDEPLTRDMVQSLLKRRNTPIAQILANRVFLFDPLDRGSGNPDFWSRERFRTEIAQLDVIPQREATALFQTVLTSDDQTELKHIMRNQAEALAASLERDDYQAAGRHWKSLVRLKVIGNDEVEQMIGEHALSRVQQHVLGCVGAFRACVVQYQFDQAERQLALLRMLTSHFPNTGLQANLGELETLLTQYKERKAEEQRNVDQKLEGAKLKAVQKVREETEQKVQQMLVQLETIIQQMDLSESEQQRIRAMGQDARSHILEGIGKN